MTPQRNQLQQHTVSQPAVLVRGLRRFVALGLAISLASCAAMQQRVGGWFGATPTPTPAPTLQTKAAAPRVYYAGTELDVYSEPSTSSKVVGTLALHEKVTRSKLERGFAYVESATSGTKGWVNNAQLIWRLPTKPTTAAPAPEETETEEAPTPAVPESPAEEQSPTPTATPVSVVPPTPKPTAAGVAPSIFNPY